MEQLGFHCTDFYWVRYLRIFRKSVEKIQVSLQSAKNEGHFAWRRMCSTFMITPRWVFLRMVNVSGRSCGENQNTWCSVNFLRKFCRLWDDAKKICYSQTCHRWQCGPENVRIAWGTTKAGMQALWISNIHCSFTAIVVTRMRLLGMLCEHSLSCLCLRTVHPLTWRAALATSVCL